MGWRYRKSVNLGKHFRVNFSKSGIGWSAGGKGFRYTKKANGGTRTTSSIPGTGISYTNDYSAKNKSTTRSRSDANKIVPNPKKPHKNWLTAIAIILIIILLFTLNLFNLFAFIGLFYVLYIALYKFVLKRKPPYELPTNKSKLLRTRWIALMTVILFIFGAAANSPSAASSQNAQQSDETVTDSKEQSNSAESIAKSESIASSKSESESYKKASESSEAEEAKKASESVAVAASESAARASSESAQRVAESNSIAESNAAAQAAAESARQASEAAAQASANAAAQRSYAQTTTATNNAPASTNNTTGIRWAIEDGYTWATRKGHSRRLSPGEPLPAGYHYQVGN